MGMFRGMRPVWGEHFSIDEGCSDSFVRIAQSTDTHFQLESTIEYSGATGLEHKQPPLTEEAWQLLRFVSPGDLPSTDLASVPAPMRWWVNTYGRHTPAALIHDRFIGLPEGLPQILIDSGIEEPEIDRYFRFMLGDSGVGFIQRWVMWSAVALRTRWTAGGLRRGGIVVWVALAAVGLFGAIWAALSGAVVVLLALVLAPWPAARASWGRQWGAGVVASYLVFPLLVPIAISVALLMPFYYAEKWFGRSLERLCRRIFKKSIEPAFYYDDPIRSPVNETAG